MWVCMLSFSVVSDSATLWMSSPPGSSVHGIFQGRILECVAIFLLQGGLPTLGWNPGLPPCRRTLCLLSHWQAQADGPGAK